MVYSEEPDMSNSSVDFGQTPGPGPGQRVRVDDRLPSRNGSNSTQPLYSNTHSPNPNHRTPNHHREPHHRPSTSYS